MPTLTREVRVVQPDPAEAAALADAARDAVRETLRPLPLLKPLSAAQLERVAAQARLETYTTEERLVAAGEDGDSLFVVRRGRVRVEVAGSDGRAVTVATRGPGEFFGEMSLLTGAPRSATVVADRDTDVVVVGRAAFAHVLLADPRIADALSETLAARLAETEEHLSAAAAEAEAARAELRASLRGKIRALFGLNEAT
jgi:CRP-like cAMP-binding protein